MGKLYIVTGATGFVGNQVIRNLEAKGETVYAFLRNSEKAANALKGTKARQFIGDVRDKASLEAVFEHSKNFDGCVCIHTASVVLIGGKKKQYEAMFDINKNGAMNIIDLCLKYNARLLYVSSVHAITEKPHSETMTEIKDFDRNTVVGRYAKSKAEVSKIVMDAVKERGLDAVLVHPAGITGPGDFNDNHLTQMVIDYMSKKIPAATKGGYDFVDVRDVAYGVVAAAEKGKTGDCYLLSNKYYTVTELLTTLYEITGIKKIKTTLPMWLARFSLPFLTLYSKISRRRPLYTSYSLYTLRSNSLFSHEKATNELDYHPRSLKESLTDTVEFLNTRFN